MTALTQLLATLKVQANVFHNGQYCGAWAVDTSGSGRMTFHLVTYGVCHVEVGNETFRLEEGDAVYFPSDSKHRATGKPDETVPVNQSQSLPFTEPIQSDATGLVCGDFGHEHPLFEKLLRQLPEYIVVRRDGDSASAKLAALMLQESRQSDMSSNLLLNRLADCLFYILLRDHVDTESGVFAAFSHPKISKSMERIHQSGGEKLTLESLASVAGMSRSAFASLFKDIVHQSPMEYITQWRMTQAYRWLVDDGISTYEAALRTGYESEASFSKAFKRVMSIGPGEARKTLALTPS